MQAIKVGIPKNSKAPKMTINVKDFNIRITHK